MEPAQGTPNELQHERGAPRLHERLHVQQSAAAGGNGAPGRPDRRPMSVLMAER